MLKTLKIQSLIILVVSVFTFIGLPSLQSISYFTSLFNKTIVITLEAEEESEGSKEEAKEVFSKEFVENEYASIFQCNLLNRIAFKELPLKEYNPYFEVITPPPEFS